MELRQRALEVLRLTDPEEKALAVLALHAQQALYSIASELPLPPVDPALLPGHPAKPELRHHTAMARRGPGSPEGRVVLVHAIAHIEFNAINLALDAIWRFGGMPRAYYLDWLQEAAEEATHFSLLRGLLQDMGYDYGDFAAHTGL